MTTRAMALRMEQIQEQLNQIQQSLAANNIDQLQATIDDIQNRLGANNNDDIANMQATLNQIQGNVAANINSIQPLPFNPQIDNFARWLGEIQQIMQILHIDQPAQQKVYLLRYLGTEGRNAVAGMDLAGDATYQQVTQFLQNRFANQVGTPFKRRELELMRPQSGETPEQYADRISLAVSKAYPNGAAVIRNQMGVAKYISTVEPAFLQEKLACENFDTLIAASNRARQLLDARNNSTSCMVGNIGVDNLLEKLNKLNLELAALKLSNTNAPRIRCEICNRSNHSSKDCFFRQKKPNPMSNIVCNYCRNIGHVAKDCRKRLGAMTSPQSFNSVPRGQYPPFQPSSWRPRFNPYNNQSINFGQRNDKIQQNERFKSSFDNSQQQGNFRSGYMAPQHVARETQQPRGTQP